MHMRAVLLSVGLFFVLTGCGGESLVPGASTTGNFVTDQHVVYSDGLHNENTEMIRLGDRLLLAFRGGEEGQTGSSRARIKIFESTDDGQTYTLISEVNANNLPGERDIRDPKLVEMGDKLFLYDISRLPGFGYRDLGGQAWTVRAESADGGHTWTPPEKTYTDMDGANETFWGFWRFTKRTHTISGESVTTLFATGYNDGDTQVGLFASDDGVNWEKRAIIINSSDDVPSEAELQFFGDNQDTAVSLVRLDNQGVLEDGQTAICTATDPFTTWECGRRIEQRLDGPTWIVRPGGANPRNFVFARKHLPCTFKRTAAYELRGDLTNPNAAITVCEIQELESEGDTAYTSLVPLTANQYLLAWYSSVLGQELPWLEGQFTPSDIWLSRVDFDAAPTGCVPPPAKRACQPPPLPSGTAVFDVSGQHLFTLAPVIWPSQSIPFRADVTVHEQTLDLTLQPLDAVTKEPVGDPWAVTDVPIAADGSFTADFGTWPLPPESYPLLDDPFLTVNEFVVTGKTVSADAFCGNISGYAQIFGNSPADRVGLAGSTFGATRITGETLPPAVGSCAEMGQ
jgi:hypothetical protein